MPIAPSNGIEICYKTFGDSAPVANGRRTIEAIPGAELVEIAGMGHDIPPGAWDQVIDAICSVAARASAPAGR